MYVDTNNCFKAYVHTIGRESLRCFLNPQPLPLLRGDAPPALLLPLLLVLLLAILLVLFRDLGEVGGEGCVTAFCATFFCDTPAAVTV
jgi:hypothetical protein